MQAIDLEQAQADLEQARAVEIECVRHSFKHFRGILGTTFVLLAIVTFMLRGRAPPGRLELWAATLSCLLLIRLGIVLLYQRRAPKDAELGPWLAVLSVTLSVSALIWGCLVFVPGRPDDAVANTVALVFSAGLLAGGSQSFIGTPKTFAGVAVGLMAPTLWFFFSSGVPEHRYLGVSVLLYLVSVAGMATQNSRLLRGSIALRFGNLDLVRKLTIEKSRAESARDLAERATTSKDQFLAAASHDIRQPIQAAFLFLGALEQHNAQAKPEVVEGLRVSLVAARQMLDELLDVSKLDAGVVERTDTPCAAAALAARIEALLGPVAERKGLKLRLRAPEGLWFRSDPTLCQRILVNLTSNALKYSEQGGVLVSFRRAGGRCRVQVWDTGIGIPAGEFESVFEEFKQLNNPERDGLRGIGLGLSIVRRLCLLLGTRIEVRSVLGRGSVFSFDLPLARAVDLTLLPLEATAELACARLLVVDDNTMIRDGLCALLSAWGYHVTAARDVTEARAAAAQNPALELALVDYRLPGDKTGIDAIDAINETLGRKILAVIITGDTDPQRIREANSGGYPVVFKPLPPDVLKQTLARTLSAEQPRK